MLKNVFILFVLITLFNHKRSNAQDGKKYRQMEINELLYEIESLESASDTFKIILATNYLVSKYGLMKNGKRALEIGYENMRLAELFQDSCLLGMTCNHIGIVYGNMKKYDRFYNIPIGDDFFILSDSAISFYNRSISLGIDCELNSIGWGYAGLTRQHYFRARMGHKNFDTAFYYSDQALEKAVEMSDRELELHVYIWEARCYSQMRDFKRATSSVRKAYKMAKESGEGLDGVYDVWYGIMTIESDNDSILWLHAEILANQRKQNGIDMQKAIQEADVKYQTNKKEREIALQKKELELRKQQFIYIGIAFTCVIILATYLFHLSKKNKRLSTRNELLLKEQNHRVKNNLQMINSLLSLQSQKLLSSDAKEALNESQLRINSVALLHRILYEGENVGKVNAKEYLKTLTEEINYAVPREVDLHLYITEGLSLAIERTTSLGLIINELMTNSIKHVEEDISLKIEIELKQIGNELTLNYSDNGSGISEEVWNTSRSFGNQLIKIQSEQLRGHYQVNKNNGFEYQLKMGA